MNVKLIEWVLRIAVAGEFIGHGVFALQGKLVLIRPVRIALLWMVFWGFWTALIRPLVGMPVWDFVERWTNWGAPLALLLSLGWPKGLKEWFK